MKSHEFVRLTKLPTSDFRLPTSDFRLPTSDFPTAIIDDAYNQDAIFNDLCAAVIRNE